AAWLAPAGTVKGLQELYSSRTVRLASPLPRLPDGYAGRATSTGPAFRDGAGAPGQGRRCLDAGWASAPPGPFSLTAARPPLIVLCIQARSAPQPEGHGPSPVSKADTHHENPRHRDFSSEHRRPEPGARARPDRRASAPHGRGLLRRAGCGDCPDDPLSQGLAGRARTRAALG